MVEKEKKCSYFCPDCRRKVIPANKRRTVFFCEKCESIYDLSEVKERKEKDKNGRN